MAAAALGARVRLAGAVLAGVRGSQAGGRGFPPHQLHQFPGYVRPARLTSPTGEASIGVREMEDRTVFISSCSRRGLARRRPTARTTGTLPLTIMVLAMLVAVVVVLATRGIV